MSGQFHQMDLSGGTPYTEAVSDQAVPLAHKPTRKLTPMARDYYFRADLSLLRRVRVTRCFRLVSDGRPVVTVLKNNPTSATYQEMVYCTGSTLLIEI